MLVDAFNAVVDSRIRIKCIHTDSCICNKYAHVASLSIYIAVCGVSDIDESVGDRRERVLCLFFRFYFE